MKEYEKKYEERRKLSLLEDKKKKLNQVKSLITLNGIFLGVMVVICSQYGQILFLPIISCVLLFFISVVCLIFLKVKTFNEMTFIKFSIVQDLLTFLTLQLVIIIFGMVAGLFDEKLLFFSYLITLISFIVSLIIGCIKDNMPSYEIMIPLIVIFIILTLFGGGIHGASRLRAEWMSNIYNEVIGTNTFFIIFLVLITIFMIILGSVIMTGVKMNIKKVQKRMK